MGRRKRSEVVTDGEQLNGEVPHIRRHYSGFYRVVGIGKDGRIRECGNVQTIGRARKLIASIPPFALDEISYFEVFRCKKVSPEALNKPATPQDPMPNIEVV